MCHCYAPLALASACRSLLSVASHWTTPPPLLDAGADYLAVINGLFGAPDATAVQQRASQFSQLIHAF